METLLLEIHVFVLLKDNRYGEEYCVAELGSLQWCGLAISIDGVGGYSWIKKMKRPHRWRHWKPIAELARHVQALVSLQIILSSSDAMKLSNLSVFAYLVQQHHGTDLYSYSHFISRHTDIRNSRKSCRPSHPVCSIHIQP